MSSAALMTHLTPQQYLALEPEAADRAEIEQRLEKIHQWLASVN